MANLDGNAEPAWIERIRSEGAVPLCSPDYASSGWASPPGDIFKVRGPEYFSTKVKVPAGEFLLKPIGFDWIKGPTKLSELLNNPNHRVRKVLHEEFPAGGEPFLWAFNLQVPSKENFGVVAYFISLGSVPEGSLMDQFLKGDDEFRTSRLKMIANIVEGPWIVKKAVGEQAICIVGRALTCEYCQGDKFIEVDIDIASSVVANAVVHLALRYLTTLTVDLAFLIESQTESELPERLLGAFRFSKLNTDSARPIEMHSYGNMDTLHSSLSMRLWKSIGSFILSGTQENSSDSASPHAKGINFNETEEDQESSSDSDSSHVNGIIDNEKSKEDPNK